MWGEGSKVPSVNAVSQALTIAFWIVWMEINTVHSLRGPAYRGLSPQAF